MLINFKSTWSWATCVYITGSYTPVPDFLPRYSYTLVSFYRLPTIFCTLDSQCDEHVAAAAMDMRMHMRHEVNRLTSMIHCSTEFYAPLIYCIVETVSIHPLLQTHSQHFNVAHWKVGGAGVQNDVSTVHPSADVYLYFHNVYTAKAHRSHRMMIRIIHDIVISRPRPSRFFSMQYWNAGYRPRD